MTPEPVPEYAVRINMVSGDNWMIPIESKEEAQDLASAVINAIRWCERIWVFEDAPISPYLQGEVMDLAVNPAHIESVHIIRWEDEE